MGSAADARKPFVLALVDALQRSSPATDDEAETAFYSAKQHLLDQYEGGSAEGMAIATIAWDDIRPLIG